MPQRTCGTSGCPNAHRAKGLCSSCYNRQHQLDRHRKTTMRCTWCGATCLKATTQRFAQRFCSLDCRDTWRRRDRLPVLFVGQVVRSEPKPSPQPVPRTWVAGWCRTCGQPFVDRQPDARSCSPRCTRRYWRKQYADEVPQSVRLYVLSRDRWRCHLCKQRISRHLAVPHPRAATVDHVIPQSQGGTHEPANLRAAHMGCNSARSNRGGGEQLMLIG